MPIKYGKKLFFIKNGSCLKTWTYLKIDDGLKVILLFIDLKNNGMNKFKVKLTIYAIIRSQNYLILSITKTVFLSLLTPNIF